MMKTILFAALLSVSGVALAQATTDDQTTAPEATATTTTTTTTAPPMETPGTVDTPTTVAPGNDDPERDARGIPVISAPAVAPAGANLAVSAPAGATVVPSSNQSAVFATAPTPAESYAPCTREVTDNCVQTYERGVGPD